MSFDETKSAKQFQLLSVWWGKYGKIPSKIEGCLESFLDMFVKTVGNTS